MDESERPPGDENKRSLVEVRKFITRVWEHPLVDERLRDHRQRARKQLVLALKEYGIDEDSFVGIPVGGTRMVVDKGSDFDMILLAKNDQVFEGFEEMLQIPDTFLNKSTNSHLDIVRIESPRDLDSPSPYGSLNLLFVPDDYLSGSQEFAREARLRVIRGIISLFGSRAENFWRDQVVPVFNQFYKRWYSLEGKSRANRYIQAIEKRSKQTHVPQRWSERFLKATGEIRLPDFKSFVLAMEESGGALEILPRYAAQGIREND